MDEDLSDSGESDFMHTSPTQIQPIISDSQSKFTRNKENMAAFADIDMKNYRNRPSETSKWRHSPTQIHFITV